MVEPYETEESLNDDDGNGNDSNGNGNAELKQSGIVTSYIFQKKINSIIVTLNHVYNKKIIISSINNSDWSKTVGNFEKRLKNKGVVDKDHILQLSDVLDNNYERILSAFSEDGRSLLYSSFASVCSG